MGPQKRPESLRRTSVEVDRQRLAQVDLGAVDVEPRPAAAEAAVGGARLVARVLVVDGAVLGVIADASLRMTRPPGVTMKKTCWPSCGVSARVGARAEDDVGDAERARQELHVREHVALALGEDAGGGIEVGGRLGQRDDLVARVAAVLRRDAQAAEGEAGIERAHVGVDGGAEEVVADALRAGGEVVEPARDLRRRAAAASRAGCRRGCRRSAAAGASTAPHTSAKASVGVALRPLDDALGLAAAWR